MAPGDRECLVLSSGGMIMASSVVSELVLFIVSLLAAGIVAGSLYLVTQELSTGLVTQGKAVSSELMTDFEIINDPESIPIVNSSYVFYVRNTGKEPISFNSQSMVVMIDGLVVPPVNLTFQPSGVLDPYQIGEIYVPTSFVNSTTQFHRITIVCDNGKRKSLVFQVG